MDGTYPVEGKMDEKRTANSERDQEMAGKNSKT